MKYFYEPTKDHTENFFQLYHCDHPLFDLCTLYFWDGKGLIVVQQKYDEANKTLSWGPVDSNVANDIFLHPDFPDYFFMNADYGEENGFPIISVRKLMWALRMKPLKKEEWEQELHGLL